MATYYIDTTGSDSAGRTGLSLSQAWATLSYASSRATVTGDIIHIYSGNYIDNNRCSLSLGVSVEGDSSSIPSITTSYVASGQSDGYLYLNSPTGNAQDGNQTISYLNINGNSTTATRVGAVYFRSNVKIHHCTFTNFLYSGIDFFGTNQSYNITPTNTIPVGNEVYNCTFNNCSQRVGSNWGGHIRSEGQNGFLLYNNSFTQNSRAQGYNGNIFSGYQNYGLKVHDNSFTKGDNEWPEWNFFMEFHYSNGGIEIYNNTFVGAAAVDFSGVVRGTYEFGGRIYDNTFDSSTGTLPPFNSHNEPCIDFESFAYQNDLYVFRNHMKNCRLGITYGNIQTSSDNVWVYDNIIEQVGNTANNWSIGIYIHSNWGETTPISLSNVYVYNNVIQAGKACSAGISVRTIGTITNLKIRNNIITGVFVNSIEFTTDRTPTINMLDINNNIFHDYSSDDIAYNASITYTDRTETNNSFLDPLFEDEVNGDFHLSSSGSPAYWNGMYVGLVSDYDSVSWHNPPSIGAYEYATSSPSVLTDSLRAYWALNDTSGTTVVDSLGTYNGTSVNTPTLGFTGKLGTALSFSRTDLEYVNCGSVVGDIGTSDFSISAWIYLPTLPSTNIGICGNWGDAPYFYLALNSSNYIRGVVNFGGGNQEVFSNSAVLASTWYHIVVTFDRSGNALMYVNGVLQTDVENISAGISTSIVNTNNFNIGQIGSALSGYYFNGTIDEVGFWTRLLLSDEVLNLYNAGVGLTYPFVDTVPSVSTTTISSITETTASSGGNVTSDGGSTVTARGVCWSTLTNPTVANSHTTNGSGTGSFTSSISGLVAGTNYYVRAYATNAVGTAYGNNIAFITEGGGLISISFANLCNFVILESFYVELTDGITAIRKGVRGGSFVVDNELTELGFDGNENTDWENIKLVN